jgi:diadenosine tetraphosphatase ApaH/serine/threonine PP2A family protein phosphatase
MRVALISDIHANWEALSAVADDIRNQQAESVACLGDVIGYGADPSGCLIWAREHCRQVMRGNHEAALLDVREQEPMNPVAKEAIVWTAAHIRKEDLPWVCTWPLTALEGSGRLVHGSPDHPELFNYLTSRYHFINSFSAFSESVCFYGHTHHPLAAEWDPAGKGLKLLPPGPLAFKPGCRYLVNVGSVGQPRDGDPRACWVLWDDGSGQETMHLEFRRVGYDLQKAQKKILEAGLPEILADRLSYGR